MSMNGNHVGGPEWEHWNKQREKLTTLVALVSKCTYKPGWEIAVGWETTETSYRPYIQVSVTTEAEASMESAGPTKGTRNPWKGGKQYLSLHMCRQEVVSACFAAFLSAEEHESREWFRYNGASIYNPHLDPDMLATIARKKSSFNVRENAMTMVET